jgi:hypothetical protein
METKVNNYTRKDAEKFMDEVAIILGLDSNNIPANLNLFYDMLIADVLNKYGTEKVIERIKAAAKGIFEYDLKIYNKPISIAFFLGLAHADPRGKVVM